MFVILEQMGQTSGILKAVPDDSSNFLAQGGGCVGRLGVKGQGWGWEAGSQRSWHLCVESCFTCLFVEGFDFFILVFVF